MPGRAVTILLVEDNHVDREAIMRAFARQGLRHPVQMASDGVEALEILRGQGGRAPLGRPHVLLLDLNLPRMGGLQLLRRLREDDELRASVVFALTTSNRDEDRAEAYRLNVAGYVVERAVGALAELLDRYLRLVELP